VGLGGREESFNILGISLERALGFVGAIIYSHL